MISTTCTSRLSVLVLAVFACCAGPLTGAAYSQGLPVDIAKIKFVESSSTKPAHLAIKPAHLAIKPTHVAIKPAHLAVRKATPTTRSSLFQAPASVAHAPVVVLQAAHRHHSVSVTTNDSGDCASCSVTPRTRHRWHTQARPWLQATHWGYAECFCERPFGSYLKCTLHAQVRNGLVSQMVLYEYDFDHAGDASQLNRRGEEQLRKLANLALHLGGLIVVQRSHDHPELDAVRLTRVAEAAARLDLPIEPGMIVLGKSPLIGLQGNEALIIYGNQLQQTRARGLNSGGQSTGASFSGGIGLGGSP